MTIENYSGVSEYLLQYLQRSYLLHMFYMDSQVIHQLRQKYHPFLVVQWKFMDFVGITVKKGHESLPEVSFQKMRMPRPLPEETPGNKVKDRPVIGG